VHFVQEVVRFGNKPWKGEIDDVHEALSDRIWRENPGVFSFAECLAHTDPELRAFAEFLDESWEFIDLRHPKLGDGFSWGRYGPKTVNKKIRRERDFREAEEESWSPVSGCLPIAAPASEPSAFLGAAGRRALLFAGRGSTMRVRLFLMGGCYA
jgi:hypothetical protein